MLIDSCKHLEEPLVILPNATSMPWAMDGSPVRHKNGVRQTTRFRQIHRNVRIVRSRSFKMIGNRGMGVKYKNRIPKLITQSFNCTNLIRVACNEHETLRVCPSCINHCGNGNINIRSFFFELNHSCHSIPGFGTSFAFFVQKRKSDLVFVVESFMYLNSTNGRYCLKVNLLPLNSCDVIWIGTYAGSEEFYCKNLMIRTKNRTCECFEIEPFATGIVFKKPIVKVIPIYVNYCLFHQLKKCKGLSPFGSSPCAASAEPHGWLTTHLGVRRRLYQNSNQRTSGQN